MDEHSGLIELRRSSPLPFTRTSRRKRAVFYTQLAHMLDVGISPTRALRTLAEQRGSWRLSRAAAKMVAAIQEGTSLAGAMAEQPNAFPEDEVRMVEAAQHGGAVPDTLLRLAKAHERVRRFWRKFITKLIYPSIIVLAAWFVLPLFVAAFLGGFDELLISKLIDLVTLVGGSMAVVTWWRFIGNISVFKRLVHGFILWVPLFGTLARRLATARFAEMFECLYSAGVRVPEAMSRAALTCGNAVLARRLLSVVPMVVEGSSLTEALAQSRAIPSMGMNFIEIGETSGKLDETLLKFAEYQRVDAETLLMRLATLLPLVIYLGVMLMTALYIIGIYRKGLATVGGLIGGDCP
ncbi:type II secretion system F family protein [bacterium]|nr:type II secretion system F family protein [bacterium]